MWGCEHFKWMKFKPAQSHTFHYKVHFYSTKRPDIRLVDKTRLCFLTFRILVFWRSLSISLGFGRTASSVHCHMFVGLLKALEDLAAHYVRLSCWAPPYIFLWSIILLLCSTLLVIQLFSIMFFPHPTCMQRKHYLKYQACTDLGLSWLP